MWRAGGWRLAAGLGQIVVATALLVAWFADAPSGLIGGLVVLTGLLVLTSRLRWS